MDQLPLKTGMVHGLESTQSLFSENDKCSFSGRFTLDQISNKLSLQTQLSNLTNNCSMNAPYTPTVPFLQQQQQNEQKSQVTTSESSNIPCSENSTSMKSAKHNLELLHILQMHQQEQKTEVQAAQQWNHMLRMFQQQPQQASHSSQPFVSQHLLRGNISPSMAQSSCNVPRNVALEQYGLINADHNSRLNLPHNSAVHVASQTIDGQQRLPNNLASLFNGSQHQHNQSRVLQELQGAPLRYQTYDVSRNEALEHEQQTRMILLNQLHHLAMKQASSQNLLYGSTSGSDNVKQNSAALDLLHLSSGNSLNLSCQQNNLAQKYSESTERQNVVSSESKRLLLDVAIPDAQVLSCHGGSGVAMSLERSQSEAYDCSSAEGRLTPEPNCGKRRLSDMTDEGETHVNGKKQKSSRLSSVSDDDTKGLDDNTSLGPIPVTNHLRWTKDEEAFLVGLTIDCYLNHSTYDWDKISEAYDESWKTFCLRNNMKSKGFRSKPSLARHFKCIKQKIRNGSKNATLNDYFELWRCYKREFQLSDV